MDADVLIIGAGAAGLAAARVFKNAGKPALLLESSQRKGGRALTLHKPFGVPWDVGAHWLHYGDHNPFMRYGSRRDVKFDVQRAPDDYTIYSAAGSNYAKPLSAADKAQFHARTAEVVNALIVVPTDKSPHKILGLLSSLYDPWYQSIALILGNWDMGKDWNNFSNQDYQRAPYYDPYPDYLCRQGYGALVAYSARDIDVRTGITVTSIKLKGDGVVVTTTNGPLTAKKCIVTVSTGVLAAETIDIEGMPPALSQAFADVSMGHYERIPLQFEKDVFGNGADRYAFRRVETGDGAQPKGIVFTTNVADENIVYADVAGSYVKELPPKEQDRVNLALDEVVNLLGEDVRKAFVKGTATNWTGNPHTLGAFASPGPRKANQRLTIIDAHIEKRVFFAGEAHHLTEWATVSGAHKSGCATAQRVMTLLYKSPVDAKLSNSVEIA